MKKEEVLKFGLQVFNNENIKFNRWLKKRNEYLGAPPENLLETDLGIKQVKDCLNRIEYGNLA